MYTIKELSNKVITIECGSSFSPFVIEHNSISGNVFGNTSYQLLNAFEVLAYIANPMLFPEELGKRLPIHCHDAENDEEFFLAVPYTNTAMQIKEPETFQNPFCG